MKRSWLDELDSPSAGTEPDAEFRARLRDAVVARGLTVDDASAGRERMSSSRGVSVLVAAACVILVFGLGWALGRQSNPAPDLTVADGNPEQTGAPTGVEPPASRATISQRPTSPCAPQQRPGSASPAPVSVAAGLGPDDRFFIAVAVDGRTVATVCLPTTLAEEYFDGTTVYAVAAPSGTSGEVTLALVTSERTSLEPFVDESTGMFVNPAAPGLIAYVVTVTGTTPPLEEPLNEFVNVAVGGEIASGKVQP